MRTDLPQEFIDETKRSGRFPLQLLVFHFGSTPVFVTDSRIIKSTGEIWYIVENWGNITSVTDVTKYIQGNASPTTTATVTLLNMGIEKFSVKFIHNNPINVRVDYYQGFNRSATARKLVGYNIPDDFVLIDSFIVQDPIAYDEAASLLRLDLVSVNQYADPYVGRLNPDTNEFEPVFIGAGGLLPGTPKGTFPITTLDADVTSEGSVFPCSDDLASMGFPSSGSILVDYEIVSYSGISGSDFTGCVRGQPGGVILKDQYAGAQVQLYNHEYLFTFAANATDLAGPVYVDGELYDGNYTIYEDRSPIEVGFNPYPGKRGANYTISESYRILGHRRSFWSIDGTWITQPPEIFVAGETNASVYVGQAQFSSWGARATVTFDFNTDDVANLREYTDIHDFNMLSSISATNRQANYPYLGTSGYIQSHATLVDAALNKDVTPPQWCTQGSIADGAPITYGSIQDWLSTKTYTVNQLNCVDGFSAPVSYDDTSDLINGYGRLYVYHHSFVLGQTIELNISGVAGSTNPANAISLLLSKIGVGNFIDSVSFDAAATWYDDNGYTFTGYIPGDYRCRQTIREMCVMARCGLKYSGGKISIFIRQPLDSRPIDAYHPKEKLQEKSISVVHQSVRDIVNDFTIRYSPNNVQSDYEKTVNATDDASIIEFGIQEKVFDAYLIDDDAMAQDVANFWLSETKDPYIIVSFNAYLEAFPYELNDVIQLNTNYNDFFAFTGDIVNIRRQFGSGKSNAINLFTITLKATKYSIPRIMRLYDSIGVYEYGQLDIKPTPKILLTDPVIVDDTGLLVGQMNGLALFDTVVVADTVYAGIKDPLLIDDTETVIVNDSALLVMPVYKQDLADTVAVDDSDIHVGIKLPIAITGVDVVAVNDTGVDLRLMQGVVLSETVIVNDTDIIAEIKDPVVIAGTEVVKADDTGLDVRVLKRRVMDDIVAIDDASLSLTVRPPIVHPLADSVVVNDATILIGVVQIQLLSDSIVVDDTGIVPDVVPAIRIEITDVIKIDDTELIAIIEGGYGSGGYGQKPYGD